MTFDEFEPNDPLRGAAELLRAPIPLTDGLTGRIATRRIRRQRARRASWGAAALVLVAVGALAIRPASADREVTFVLHAPTSHSVALVGDFTDWKSDKIQLEEGNGGEWRVKVKLAPGRYRFSYLVDKDEWRADADDAPIPDDYGRPTSVVTVTMEQ